MLSPLLVLALAAFSFEDATGCISSFPGPDGPIVGVENVYHLMTKAGAKADVDAREREDRVVRKTEGDGWVAYRCENPKLPGIEIVKRYRRENGGLRRTLAFRNTGSEPMFVTPFTECRFRPEFQDGLWHLGAGYIGPYKPFPKEERPRPVNEYRQSSKGLVFIHPDGRRGNFSHYRVRIDDQVVFPWWHSTIGRYRELHDRLWYLPDGYRMGLGTFALQPGRIISVTDQFNAFEGDMFTFFDGIFGKDPDVVRELASIPPAPAWNANLFSIGGADYDDYVRWLCEMTDEGDLLPRHWGSFSWGDYRADRGLRGVQGGRITGDEMAAFMASMRAYDPKRVHTCLYQIVISTSWFTDVFREHPDWFRVHDRDGNADSLFPGVSDNWQTMFNNPECRAWMVEMLIAFARHLGNDNIYVDESQMTNTIDWDRLQVTLDSDSVRFWKLFKKRLHEEGWLFFANGSGNAYADLNYMESPHELSPLRWRDWVGVAWGIGLFNRLRPEMRMSPLVWRDGLDYVNRILALGWVPHSYCGNAVRLPVMRAVYQSGSLLPMNAKYAPDWKTDAAVEVESHSTRRTDAKDVVLSFINRAKGAADIPIEVDLASLGFAADERIGVWRLHVDEHRTGDDLKDVLSDRQLKRNWRERGVLDGARITDPELVHSGPATGTCRTVIRGLGKDRIEQFLVTASPAALFAEDGLPLNSFYTAQRHARIVGRKVTVEREADVLLADLRHDFAAVTANGKPVGTRRIALNGGLVGTLVRLGKGEWTLGWTETPRKDGDGRAELPVRGERMTADVKPPRCYIEDEILDVKEANVERNGVRILKSGVYRTKIPTVILLQTNLSITCTAADPKALRLVAGPSRREFAVRDLETAAGFELDGARQVRLRFAHNFNDDSVGVNRNRFKTGDNAGKPDEYFAGLLVDYSVGGMYVKRVSMSTGFYHPACALRGAKWGKFGRADEILDFGEWLEEPSPRVFSLDLGRFAPKGWDGKAWLSLGTCRMLAGHHLELEILSFNDASAKDFLVPTVNANARVMPPPLRSRPLKAKPRSLERIDPEEWKGWARTTPFMSLGSGRPKAQTVVSVAHDYEYMYFGIEAEEPAKPVLSGMEAWSNDNLQILVRRPDDKVYQVIVDPAGRYVHLLDRVRDMSGNDGIVGRGEVVGGRCWRAFFAVPIDGLKFDMQRTPVTVRAEFARERKGVQERSAWTPLEGNYFEGRNYGTIVLDFNWSR